MHASFRQDKLNYFLMTCYFFIQTVSIWVAGILSQLYQHTILYFKWHRGSKQDNQLGCGQCDEHQSIGNAFSAKPACISTKSVCELTKQISEWQSYKACSLCTRWEQGTDSAIRPPLKVSLKRSSQDTAEWQRQQSKHITIFSLFILIQEAAGMTRILIA
jgi:hypothetical protein